MYYWPVEPRQCTVEAFIRAFQSLGYTVCESALLEPALEKIAVYVGDNGQPTHVARQLESGQWTSKCGKAEDITHFLEALEGTCYGRVAVIMQRTLS